MLNFDDFIEAVKHKRCRCDLCRLLKGVIYGQKRPKKEFTDRVGRYKMLVITKGAVMDLKKQN